MAKANTHLTHLEELVLTQGPAGYKMARAFLLELLKTLKGNTGSKIQTSVKWDGAPAIFAGVNGYLDDIEVKDIVRFESALMNAVRESGADILNSIRTDEAISDETEKKLKNFIGDFAGTFN